MGSDHYYFHTIIIIDLIKEKVEKDRSNIETGTTETFTNESKPETNTTENVARESKSLTTASKPDASVARYVASHSRRLSDRMELPKIRLKPPLLRFKAVNPSLQLGSHRLNK